LRDLDWRGPILLLEGVFEQRDLELCSRLDLWHVVHHEAQIDMLSRHKTQVPQRVFLKMNSGMNRLGFAPERFRSAWARLNALPQVDEISLMTHFAHADDAVGVDTQLKVVPRHQPRPAGRTQPGQQRGGAAPPYRCASDGRLGATRHCLVRQRARPSFTHCRALGLATRP
jgi:alanine racemase